MDDAQHEVTCTVDSPVDSILRTVVEGNKEVVIPLLSSPTGVQIFAPSNTLEPSDKEVFGTLVDASSTHKGSPLDN